ncbi:MAG: PKD domain-containing protein [Dehalococcoidia bacterium]|nr:PKD domain-containing protein [Dehalococcoidia bacterium]
MKRATIKAFSVSLALIFVIGLLMAGVVPASAQDLVIDDFASGTVTLSACGNSTFNYYQSPTIVGGARELQLRDGHSCALGGSARMRVDATAGIAEWYGATAPEGSFQYGTEIGTIDYPWSLSPNKNKGTPLNLSLTLGDKIRIEMVQVQNPFIQIRLRDGAGATYVQNFSLAVGTNLLPLSSFPGLTPAAAADIDGISFRGSASSGNTPGSGDIVGLFAIAAPANTPPTVAATNASVTTPAGMPATNSGTYSDTDAGQTVAITASVGTVTKTGTNSGTWSWSNPSTIPTSYNVTVTANDGNGGIATTSFAVTVTSVVYTSGAQVQTWNPIFPSSAYSDWPNQACVPMPAVGLGANWVNPHNAFSFGTNAHPWQPTAGFIADWINAWSNLGSQGPSGQSWTKYQTQVSGNGSFVLNLLADNCSWVYLDGTLVGFQNANLQPRTYPVTLSGASTLTFIIFDGGGLAGGMYRLETNSGNVTFPVIAADNASVTTNQGTPATNTGTYSYANGGGNVPVTASVGTVTKTGTNSGTWSWSNPSNAAPFDYDVTITAGSGPAAFTQFHVHVVTNAPPTVSAASASVSVNEGLTAANTGSYNDSDAIQTVAITASVGTVTKTGTNSGTWSWSNPAPDGPSNYNVTITANDGNGGVTTTTFAIAVTNVNPTANAGPDVTQFWGLLVTLTGAGADVSPIDVAAGLIATWIFGDGPGTASGFSVTHTYAAPGGYTATLTVKDKDGGTGSDTALATIKKRGTSVAYTGATTSTFGFGATLSAKLTDVVDAGTALLGGRAITFTVNGNTITATTNASGVATATAPALLMPGTYPVAVAFAEDGYYLASTAQGTLTVQNTVGGKVTAGTLRSANNGRGGFNVQADGTGVKGELEFQNNTVNFHAPTMTALGVSPDKKKAWFAGVGKDGAPFVAYVEDNGEPGRNDKYQIWIGGTSQNGDGSLTGGNVQIH